MHLIGKIERKPITETKLNLNESEQVIFDIIGVEPKGFDEIQALTGLNTEDLLMRLTEMELSCLIEQVEGDRYVKVRQ